MKLLKGVITAMTTPFNKSGALMEDALRAQTEFLIARGVNCLYPCGTTGEMLRMSEQTRKRTAEVVVCQADHRLPVYVHVGAPTTAETVRLARHAAEIGADGVGVVTPSFFKLTDEEMAIYYETVAGSLPDDFPVYMYCIPQLALNDISPAVAARVANNCKNVVGIKYSKPDIIRTREYAEARAGFSVLQGCDRLPLPFLVAGCSGIVSGLSGALPEPLVEMWRAYEAGDMALAKRLEARVRAMYAAIPDDHNICYIKAALPLRGLPENFVIPPYADVVGDELIRYRAALRAAAPEYFGGAL